MTGEQSLRLGLEREINKIFRAASIHTSVNSPADSGLAAWTGAVMIASTAARELTHPRVGYLCQPTISFLDPSPASFSLPWIVDDVFV